MTRVFRSFTDATCSELANQDSRRRGGTECTGIYVRASKHSEATQQLVPVSSMTKANWGFVSKRRSLLFSSIDACDAI